ncbi:MAG: DUF222 domain-containing protein [Acidimicrobiales bacterium]
MSDAERTERLETLFAQLAAIAGEIVVLLDEVERSQSFREEGATSIGSWVSERFGVASATARSLAHVGEKVANLPHLRGALCAGEVSLDKVRTVADVATPESDRELCEEAQRCSVRELADVAQSRVRDPRASALTSDEQYERRFVRFNDQFRTVTAQLPSESYAEAKACLETRAKEIPSDGETLWDHRLCDAYMDVLRASGSGDSGGRAKADRANPYFVVVHVPVEALVDGDTGETAQLAGELERDGLISTEVVREIACGATIAVAIDDDVGHTMYEGRARRFPTGAQRREVRRRDRHCRFPGCTNVTFADVHHVVPWKLGGRTDLDNLAFLCRHHHGVVHRKGWSMTGNANDELTIVGPTGRVMASRPSPLWTRVTDRRRAARAGDA